MKKQFVTMALIVILPFAFLGTVRAADEHATKEECVQKVHEFADLIKAKGLDAAEAILMEPNNPFVWKDDGYVMIIDMTGTVVVHPISPKLNGKNMMGMKDVKGKLFFAEFVNIARDKGEGWVDYYWALPNTQDFRPKHAYIYRVPGMDIFLLAGVFDH